MAKNVYCQNKELSQHTLPLRGGHDGGGGGDEVWLKKTECMGGRGGAGGLDNLREGITVVVIVLLLDQWLYSGQEEAQPLRSQLKG